MKNPTTTGRVSRVLFADWTPETSTLSAYRAQAIAARCALPIEAAAIVAALYFGGSING